MMKSYRRRRQAFPPAAGRGREPPGACALPLAGCQTMSSDSLLTGSTEPASLKQTAEAAKRWEADPGNAKLAFHYIGLLKAWARPTRQLSVLAELASAIRRTKS